MKWHLVTYADSNFKEQQKFLNKVHKNNFDEFHTYDREWLEKTDFYQENKKLLDEEKGAGWWLWKPYVILETLEKVSEGDIVVYCDCGDMFSPGLKEYVSKNVGEEDLSLLLLGGHPNRQYTKKDCFVGMSCDDSDYWDSTQLEAGFMVWKASKDSIAVVDDWLNWCLQSEVMNDEPSTLDKDAEDFKEHRHDQSILTNIAIREGLSVGGPEYRNFIECDYDYWYERNEKQGFHMGREIDSFLLSIKNA
jgi:hypothetical protein